MAVGYGNWLIVLTRVGDYEWSAMAYGPDGAVGGRYGAPVSDSSLSSVLDEAKAFIARQPEPKPSVPQPSAAPRGDHWTIELTGTEAGWRAVVSKLSNPPGESVTFEGPTHEAVIDEAGEYIDSAYPRAPGMR